MKKITLFLLVCFLILSIGCNYSRRIKEPDFVATLEKAELEKSTWYGACIYRLEFNNGAIVFFQTSEVPVFKIGTAYGVYKRRDDYVWRVDEVVNRGK